jgi:hypothetical protein
MMDYRNEIGLRSSEKFPIGAPASRGIILRYPEYHFTMWIGEIASRALDEGPGAGRA